MVRHNCWQMHKKYKGAGETTFRTLQSIVGSVGAVLSGWCPQWVVSSTAAAAALHAWHLLYPYMTASGGVCINSATTWQDKAGIDIYRKDRT